MAFRKGLKYHHMDERLYSTDDQSTACKNLVNFSAVDSVPKITTWQMIGKNWHISQNISEFTGPIFTLFSGLISTFMGMINLIFILRSLKGCCYGNQSFLEPKINIDWYHCHSLRWRSTTDRNIAIWMHALTAEMMPLHRVKIWWDSVQWPRSLRCKPASIILPRLFSYVR